MVTGLSYDEDYSSSALFAIGICYHFAGKKFAVGHENNT
jgi:hypothetical protein